MEKIVKHYSQAQAWHDPKRWKPNGQELILVLFKEFSDNEYQCSLATDIISDPIYGWEDYYDKEEDVPEHLCDLDLWNENEYVCLWDNVVRWAYLKDLVPNDLKTKLPKPLDEQL